MLHPSLTCYFIFYLLPGRGTTVKCGSFLRATEKPIRQRPKAGVSHSSDLQLLLSPSSGHNASFWSPKTFPKICFNIEAHHLHCLPGFPSRLLLIMLQLCFLCLIPKMFLHTCIVHWQAFEGHLPFRRRGLVQCKAKKRKGKADRLLGCLPTLNVTRLNWVSSWLQTSICSHF